MKKNEKGSGALNVIMVVMAFLIVWWMIGVVLSIFGFGTHAVNNLVDTNNGVIDRTLNADNAIYNYEYFKTQKEAIDANYRKIKIAQETFDSFEKNLPKDRSSWSFEDKDEDGKLRGIVMGLRNNQESTIADYNAKLNMANRNIFQDGKLPNMLDFEAGLLK